MTVERQTVEGYEGLIDVFQSIQTDWERMDYRQDCFEFSQTLKELHGSYHTGQRDPESNPWEPLAPYTVRKKGHDRILWETGRLLESVTGETEDSIREVTREPFRHEMKFGTRREDAWKHQDGYRIIPQREHVGITDQYLDPFVETIADTTVEQLIFEG